METTLSIKQLRENLGLSQSQMAILLLISKRRLSMAELNRSLLKPEEMLRFAAIYECRHQNPELAAESHTTITKGTLRLQDETNKKYHSQLRIATYKRTKLISKLQKMEVDAECAFNETHTISKLLNKAADVSSQDYYAAYVGQRKAKAHEKMISNSATAQEAVELEIKILDSQISILSEFLSHGQAPKVEIRVAAREEETPIESNI